MNRPRVLLSPAWKICAACLAGYALIPWPGAKLALAAAAAAAVACAPSLRLPSLRRSVLGFCFALALLLPPYWAFFQGAQPAPFWQVLSFVSIGCLGWVWAAAVDSLTGEAEASKPVQWWKAALLAGTLLALHWGSFHQVIPWRGDESQHVLRLWAAFVFAQAMLASWAAPAAALLALASVLLWRRSRARWSAAALGGAGGLWIYAVLDACQKADISWLTRYPAFQMWFHATALLYAPIKSWAAQEGLYRVIPFLAALALALYIARVPLAQSPAPTQLAAALAIATVPTVRYYSTLLYLDLPLAAAMTIACFEIERLAAGNGGKIPGRAGWYALLLCGFLKETAAVFVLAALPFCARGSSGRRVRLVWALGGPLAVFLMAAGSPRGYSFRPESLATLSNYPIVGAALWEQYGWLLALSATGAVLLAFEKRWLLLAFSLSVAAGYTAFYLGDGFLTLHEGVWRPRYLGHARFLLALLPAVAVLATHALRRLPRAASWTAAGLVLAGNLWVFPVSTAAAPSANWGDYVYDTSDRFYPYDAAYRRGRAEFPEARRVVVVGATFFYPHVFYQRRWNWPESVESLVLGPGYTEEAYRRNLEAALRQEPDLIWAHVMDHLPASVYESEPPGYTQAGEYRSRFHRILAYRRSAAPVRD